MSKSKIVKNFTNLRLDQELKKMSNEQLLEALHQGFAEGRSCKTENDWVLIRDTLLVIGDELKLRKVQPNKG